MYTQVGQTVTEQYKEMKPCAGMVRSMHNTADFVGKEAEALVAMNMNKF